MCSTDIWPENDVRTRKGVVFGDKKTPLVSRAGHVTKDHGRGPVLQALTLANWQPPPPGAGAVVVVVAAVAAAVAGFAVVLVLVVPLLFLLLVMMLLVLLVVILVLVLEVGNKTQWKG